MYAYTDGEYAEAISEFAASSVSGLAATGQKEEKQNNENVHEQNSHRPNAPVPIIISSLMPAYKSECAL